MIEYLQYIKSKQALEDELQNINEEMNVLGLEKVNVNSLYTINPFDTDKYVEKSGVLDSDSEREFLNTLLTKINDSHKVGRKGMIFIVDGVSYSSVTEYAAKNKISKPAASKRLKKLNVI